MTGLSATSAAGKPMLLILGFVDEFLFFHETLCANGKVDHGGRVFLQASPGQYMFTIFCNDKRPSWR
jgi:hypothetical protein